MRFDRASGAFTLEFEPSLAADTEVYLNEELYYPHGCRQAPGKSQAAWTCDELARYDLHLDHPECFRVTRATNRVTLGDAGCRGKQVAVRVTAKTEESGKKDAASRAQRVFATMESLAWEQCSDEGACLVTVHDV